MRQVDLPCIVDFVNDEYEVVLEGVMALKILESNRRF